MQAISDVQVASVNAGARLDRLPICGFHWRILALIGAGMFLDAFDIYLAGGVLGAVLKENWSTLELNAAFVTATFIGMTLGAWFSGTIATVGVSPIRSISPSSVSPLWRRRWPHPCRR